MQQTAQQNPMFGAGLAVAPENTEQAPQQMAATGGITALARGGEVRGFDGTDGSLAKLVEDENAVEDAATTEEDGIANEGKWFENFAKQANNTDTDLLNKYKAYTNTAPSAGLPSINLGGDLSSPYGKYKPPTLDAPISNMGMPIEQTSPKDDYRLSDMVAPRHKVKKEPEGKHRVVHTPADTSSAARNEAAPTAKGETYQGLDKYLSKGVVNPSSYDADAVVASMLNKDTTPHLTAEESIARYQELLGPEADMSEEVAMARENAANASRDKGLGALVGGIGGMLSAQTPYMGQAVGAGLMSGLSSYQSGAKEQGTADKELMALQMAQKKSDLAGRRTAAEAYIGQQAKMAEKAEEARAKREETMLGIRGNYGVEQVRGANAANVAKINAASDQAKQMLANMSEMDKARFVAGTLTAKDIAAAAGSGLRGGLEWKDIQATMEGILGMTGVGPNPAGSSGGGFGQPIKNGMYIK
jgi:hypothetical protein